jgi:hypothetical protein
MLAADLRLTNASCSAHSGWSVLVRRRGAAFQYRPFAFSSARSAFAGPPWHDAGFTLESYPVPSAHLAAAVHESSVTHQFSRAIAIIALTVAPPRSEEPATEMSDIVDSASP